MKLSCLFYRLFIHYYVRWLVYKMSVDEMTVDEMTVDEMTVDEMTVDEMTVDEMTVDEMTRWLFKVMKSDIFPKKYLKLFRKTEDKKLISYFSTKSIFHFLISKLHFYEK